VLREIHKDANIDEIRLATEADLIIPENIKIMDV
jgi:acetate CoA/acetoacetate CoA-transferase beta subunit